MEYGVQNAIKYIIGASEYKLLLAFDTPAFPLKSSMYPLSCWRAFSASLARTSNLVTRSLSLDISPNHVDLVVYERAQNDDHLVYGSVISSHDSVHKC